MMDNIKWIKKQIRSTLDYQYITKIVDDYLEKNDKDFLKQYQENNLDFIYISKQETMDIIFIAISHISKNSSVDKKYQQMKEYILKNHLKKLDLILSSLNEEDRIDAGVGFAFTEYSPLYQEKEVKDTFAKYFMDKILSENKEQLSKKINKTFKTIQKFHQYGVKRYIIDYLSFYDKYLANYIAINHKLISKELLQSLNISFFFQSQEENQSHLPIKKDSTQNKILILSKK